MTQILCMKLPCILMQTNKYKESVTLPVPAIISFGLLLEQCCAC